MSDTEQETIAAFAARLNITAEATRIPGRSDWDGHDEAWHRSARHWVVTLAHEGRKIYVYYSQGIAHRKPPTVVDVLSGLQSDVSGVVDSHSFEEWAGEVDLDTDSRRAERMYRACQASARSLERLLTAPGVRQLLACEAE